MEQKRIGRQTPTVSRILPYTDSLGSEGAELYNRSGRSALEWQVRLIEDIMAVNDDGVWTHMKFGYAVPRRNGKSELVIMRSLWGLTHGERILYTAHRTNTSRSIWEKLVDRLAKSGYAEDEDFKTYKRNGDECIMWLKGGDGVINFRTRSTKGGLGEGYDLLIIDEAQEYTADQESALKYTVTDSPNPQTIMLGTPPTVVSSGDVFLKYRRRVLTGEEQDAGWAEWSVPQLSDAHDPELWYETNPSLGTILSERTIRSELGDDQVDDNIQRLGLWLTYSQKSAISRREWDSFALTQPPELAEPHELYFGVKYSKTTPNVSLAVACKTADGRVFVEAIDCRSMREGNSPIIAYLQNPHAVSAVIDGAGNQDILKEEMKAAEVDCRAILPKVNDVIEANALFEKQLFSGRVCHSGQPSLAQSAANCEHRPIGTGGGFGYQSGSDKIDAGLIEAVSLAHWLCAKKKELPPQEITY
jgi:phage terminase large subunit-like protein